MRSSIVLILVCVFSIAGLAQAPRPTKAQLAWHDMDYYFFIHFGPNTFTDKEWGHGDEPEDIFNPTALDTDQWCRVAKAAGASGIIITAKHHDGFCLWPSKYSRHTVRESKWMKGRGDVLKLLSASCRKAGLKFGVYISPWDRNHPDYGTPAYNAVYENTMKEIFAAYGPIWELWWDGANGEGPNGKKQVYDFRRFENTIRKLSPSTVIFSDVGPDIRWVGNERGFAGRTNWNYLDTAGFRRGEGAPPVDTLNSGNAFGKNWIPAECDVSIRPGWFYHSNEDSKVKTPTALFDLYLKSVGRGANLLLNVPPDRRGLIHEADSAALVGFAELRRRSFEKNVLSGRQAVAGAQRVLIGGDGRLSKGIALRAGETVVTVRGTDSINCIVLKEGLANGQFIDSVSMSVSGVVVTATTVGDTRMLTFPVVAAANISIKIRSRGNGVLKSIGGYRIGEELIINNE